MYARVSALAAKTVMITATGRFLLKAYRMIDAAAGNICRQSAIAAYVVVTSDPGLSGGIIVRAVAAGRDRCRVREPRARCE